MKGGGEFDRFCSHCGLTIGGCSSIVTDLNNLFGDDVVIPKGKYNMFKKIATNLDWTKFSQMKFEFEGKMHDIYLGAGGSGEYAFLNTIKSLPPGLKEHLIESEILDEDSKKFLTFDLDEPPIAHMLCLKAGPQYKKWKTTIDKLVDLKECNNDNDEQYFNWNLFFKRLLGTDDIKKVTVDQLDKIAKLMVPYDWKEPIKEYLQKEKSKSDGKVKAVKAVKAVKPTNNVNANADLILNPSTGRYIKASGALAKKLGLGAVNEQPVKSKSKSPKSKSPKSKSPSPSSTGARGCVKQTTKKYLDRKSPPYPAQECAGQTLKGNDGKMYSAVSNKNAIYTWRIQK